MIQRLIGVSLGGLIIYVMLVILDPKTGDANSDYLTAIVIGSIVSFLWPWVIGFYFARKAKARRDDQISAEVDRQLAEERAKQG